MDANELLAELDKVAVRTSGGTYVKLEDVERLTRERQEEKAEVEAKPRPKNFNQAKQAIKKDEPLMARFPKRPPALGGVGDSLTSSRT